MRRLARRLARTGESRTGGRERLWTFPAQSVNSAAAGLACRRREKRARRAQSVRTEVACAQSLSCYGVSVFFNFYPQFTLYS